MSNWVKIGPVRLRIGSKHLAPWGFPRVAVHGLSFWSWTNGGDLCLASYHPASSITWLWALYVEWSWQHWGLSYRRAGFPNIKELRIGPAIFRFASQERMRRAA